MFGMFLVLSSLSAKTLRAKCPLILQVWFADICWAPPLLHDGDGGGDEHGGGCGDERVSARGSTCGKLHYDCDCSLSFLLLFLGPQDSELPYLFQQQLSPNASENK